MSDQVGRAEGDDADADDDQNGSKRRIPLEVQFLPNDPGSACNRQPR